MRRLGGAPVPPARERALGIGIQHGGSSVGLLGSNSERSDEGGLSGAALLAGDHNDVHDLPRYVLTHLRTRWRKRVHTLRAHDYETVKRPAVRPRERPSTAKRGHFLDLKGKSPRVPHWCGVRVVP